MWPCTTCTCTPTHFLYQVLSPSSSTFVILTSDLDFKHHFQLLTGQGYRVVLIHRTVRGAQAPPPPDGVAGDSTSASDGRPRGKSGKPNWAEVMSLLTVFISLTGPFHFVVPAGPRHPRMSQALAMHVTEGETTSASCTRSRTWAQLYGNAVDVIHC